MSTQQSEDQVESGLDEEAAESSHQCENQQAHFDEEKAQDSAKALDNSDCTLESEGERQSISVDVVMSGENELISTDVNGAASHVTSQGENGIKENVATETSPVASPLLESHENSSCSFADSRDNDEAPVDLGQDEESYGAELADASPVEDIELALRKRKKSLERLCNVLMDERDKATSSLKEKDDNILRLRKLAFKSEQEKLSAKNQLAKALTRIVLAEKETSVTKEENAKLTAEIERMTKRIGELEEENSDLKCQLEKARGSHGLADEDKTAENADRVTLSRVDELEENADSGETPSVFEEPGDSRQDEPKPAETASVDENADGGDGKEKAKQERAAQRAAPNFQRHSFAGILPRPFHSFELPRQSSVEHRHERSDSFESDTGSESGVLPSPGIPYFMRTWDKSSLRKSGFSPVQFNYQPLPDSILQRRESWDAMRHGSLIRARTDRAHSFSSDSGFSETDIGARTMTNQTTEGLSREEHTSELNFVQDNACFDKRNDMPAGEIENGMTLLVSSVHAENTQDSRDLITEPTTSTREIHTNDIPLQGEDHDTLIDPSQKPEEEKREKVSDLVNIWNNRTTAVFDI